MYLVLLAAGASTALVTSLIAAASARTHLGFTFAGLPRTPGAAWSVFSSNARMAVVPVVFAVVASHAADRRAVGALATWLARLAMDAVLLIGVLVNALVVGIAVGGYGQRMILALLPHGPVEVLGFSGALATYLEPRLGVRVRGSTIAVRAVACLATLAVSAVLETALRP